MSRAKKILNPFFGGDIEEINFDSQSHEAGEYSIKQNAKGAPVEKVNPLGYNLDYVTAFYMVLQGMIVLVFLQPLVVLLSPWEVLAQRMFYG